MINLPAPTEDAEQEALFQWAERAACTMPELKLLHSIPNGGKRNIVTALRMKRTGTKAGIPDLCLPVAKGNHHGLYIELKRRKGGVVSAEQKVWHNRLQEQGYCVKVCKGWVAAREAIESYLGGEKE